MKTEAASLPSDEICNLENMLEELAQFMEFLGDSSDEHSDEADVDSNE